MTDPTFDPRSPWIIDPGAWHDAGERADRAVRAAISARRIDEECNIRAALGWWVSGLEPTIIRHAVSGRLIGIGDGDEVVIRVL